MHDFGIRNPFLGVNAGNVTMTGSGNAASGAQALFSNTTGLNNTAIGGNALLNNSTGGSNTANGYFALTSNTSGGGNTAIGSNALDSNRIGTDNTAVGLRALHSLDRYFNTAVGSEALANNTTGQSNTAFGTGLCSTPWGRSTQRWGRMPGGAAIPIWAPTSRAWRAKRMQRAVVHLWGRDPDLDDHVRTLAHDIRELKRLLAPEQTLERKD